MKIIFKIIIVVAIACMAIACNDFLDQKPYSQATDETTWKSEEDANASVAACYSLIRSALNASTTYYAYGDLTSGEFNDTPGGDGAYRDVLNYNWGVGIPATSIWDPRLKLRLYTNFYSGIMQSNRCIQYISNMPADVFAGDTPTQQEARKNKYIGEAYFTRAFNYFYMSRIWGDVPLITEYTDSVATAQYSRTEQSKVLDQAIADVEEAIKVLDWKDETSGDKIVRADKGSAYALLANIYAWKGDYEKCNTACDAVINSGSYDYIDSASYLDIYKGQSIEGIFEIAQNSPTESVNAKDWGITSFTLVPPYLSNGLSQPAWQLDKGLIDYLYADQTDIRFRQSFVVINSGGGELYECVKYANIENVNNSTTYQIALNNIPIFRYSGIKLLKAEALASKAAPDYNEALAVLNELRLERGIEALDALDPYDLKYAISDEQGRELFLEGHRRFDLIRFERVIGEQQIGYVSHDEFLAGKYYWPIDPSLFSLNYHLVQTPYWAGKMR